MYPFKYDVSLRIRHPEMKADEICNQLGLNAEHKWTAGASRRTPKGTPLVGVNKSTYCCFLLEHPDGLGLIDFLVICNDKFRCHSDFFRSIRLTGGSIEYFIGWYCDKNCGEVFDLEFLSDLVTLQIDLSIDFYGGAIKGSAEDRGRP